MAARLVASILIRSLTVLFDLEIRLANWFIEAGHKYRLRNSQAYRRSTSDPGTSNQFGLKVTNPAGAVVNGMTFTPLTLVGGNLVVPHK